MPFLRILGNVFFFTNRKFNYKKYKFFDILNGFTSIDNSALRKVIKTNLDDDFFFDSVLIYQLFKLKIKVLDVSIKAKYEDEKSNINILTTGILFLFKNLCFLLGIKK